MHGCRISLCSMPEFPSDSWPSGHNKKKSHHLGLAILPACLGVCVFQKLDPRKGIDGISECVEEWAFLPFRSPQTPVIANREIFSFIYLLFLLCPLITANWKGQTVVTRFDNSTDTARQEGSQCPLVTVVGTGCGTAENIRAHFSSWIRDLCKKKGNK